MLEINQNQQIIHLVKQIWIISWLPSLRNSTFYVKTNILSIQNRSNFSKNTSNFCYLTGSHLKTKGINDSNTVETERTSECLSKKKYIVKDGWTSNKEYVVWWLVRNKHLKNSFVSYDDIARSCNHQEHYLLHGHGGQQSWQLLIEHTNARLQFVLYRMWSDKWNNIYPITDPRNIQ